MKQPAAADCPVDRGETDVNVLGSIVVPEPECKRRPRRGTDVMSRTFTVTCVQKDSLLRVVECAPKAARVLGGPYRRPRFERYELGS